MKFSLNFSNEIFLNRSIFREVVDMSRVSYFSLTHSVVFGG